MNFEDDRQTLTDVKAVFHEKDGKKSLGLSNGVEFTDLEFKTHFY